MTDSTRTSARKGGKGLTVGIGVGAVLTVAGIALWAVQLSGGMVQTGMRNMDSWGLYITMFMFFVGLSAGGLIISSIPRAFGMQGFGGISKVAVWTSICCTVLAIGFVVVDLGQPLRVWRLRLFQSGFASHVGHRRPFRIPYPFGGLPLGDACAPKPERCRRGLSAPSASWRWCAPSSSIR